jgi:hypothetical protein
MTKKKTFCSMRLDNIASQVYESYKPGYVHPEFKPYEKPLNSTPTGLSFRLMHPDDPPMAGFTKDPKTGMLHHPPSDGKATMFSPPATQYWNPINYTPIQSFNNSFDARSVNPFNGKYSISYPSKTANATKKYASLGVSKDTLLA